MPDVTQALRGNARDFALEDGTLIGLRISRARQRCTADSKEAILQSLEFMDRPLAGQFISRAEGLVGPHSIPVRARTLTA